MPVRTFDGVDDRVTCALGSTGFALGPATIAVILKRGRDTGNESVIRVGASSTSTARYGLEISTTTLQIRAGNTVLSAPTILATVAMGWVLLVVSKATGTATPRFHKYNFGTGIWTHENAGGTLVNSTSPASGPVLGANPNGSSPYAGDIGIAAIWNVVLSDAEVEALAISQANWSTVAPVALWPLDQASTATAVQDTIGAADQTALTGTTVTADTIPWAGGSDIEVTLTPATTTDAARPLSAHKNVVLSNAGTTDAAQPLTKVKHVTLTPVASTDIAQPLSVTTRVSLAAAITTDTARAATAGKGVTLTPATTTDAARPLSAHKNVVLSNAGTTDAAQPLSVTTRVSLAAAITTDTARAATAGKGVTLTPAVTADTSAVLTVTKYISIAPGLTTDTAGALAATTRLTLTPATTLESPHVLTVSIDTPNVIPGPVTAFAADGARATPAGQGTIRAAHGGSA